MAKLPGYLDGGIKMKYAIAKADGSAVDPDARYFVLRFDKDPHARVAMKAYRDSVADENRTLAWEIGKALEETAERFRRMRLEMGKAYAVCIQSPDTVAAQLAAAAGDRPAGEDEEAG